MNDRLMSDVWDKYCKGSISKWEMDAISCYIHPHELALIDHDEYGWDEFGALDPMPQIDRYIPIKGKMVPIYKLARIVGTVLDRDKAKKTVTLLTTDGVVNVKIYGVFQNYDRQISEKGADGKKHVLEKSMFSRGNIITVRGIREEDGFRAKKYSKTPGHLIEQVIIEGDGSIRLYSRTEEK
jgi:DNA polymerase-3 subunit alpha